MLVSHVNILLTLAFTFALSFVIWATGSEVFWAAAYGASHHLAIAAQWVVMSRSALLGAIDQVHKLRTDFVRLIEAASLHTFSAFSFLAPPVVCLTGALHPLLAVFAFGLVSSQVASES